MRKFKIKNRQKRKYTRKSVHASSFPHSQAISAGLLPLLILAIALVTTVIMSQAKGQTYAIDYSLPIPQPKLPDIGNVVQNIPNLFNNPIAFVTSIYTLSIDFMQQLWITIGYWFALLAHLLDPRPFIALTIRSIMFFIQTMVQFAIILGMGIVTAGTVVLQAFITVGNAIANTMASMSYAIASFILFIAAAIMHGLTFVGAILLIIAKTLIHIVTTIALFLFVKVSAFINGVVNIIEIPFKILWAFWLQIKPFFDMLGAHIKMTGDDLNNGVSSINKVGNLLSTPNK
jgi:hypothetical protein